jgi:radical SAM enzyme (TIGR01210 family)
VFIEEVVSKIWEPVSEEYGAEYNRSCNMDLEKLYETVLEEVKSVNTVVYQSRELNMIALATSGCPHNNKNGRFSGCSMCDYNSSYAGSMARINALKKRSPEKYASIVRFSLENAREKVTVPSVVELITGYDCLNSEEIPDKVYEEVINKGELFKRKRKPYKSIFETRVSSVTLDKLLAWKKNLGKKVVVEFGVEVGNDWVRNHWINKNISDEEIVNAVKTIREAGCESSANILIGIPGCAETQAIELFKASFYWLCDIGTDHILCSPLGRKSRTLQGFIHERLKDNTRLAAVGIVSGEQTGMPWIFTVMEVIQQICDERPDLVERMTLSPANFPPYFKFMEEIYKDTDKEQCVTDTIGAIKKFGNDKDMDCFADARNRIYKSPFYQEYKEMLEKQEKAGNITDTFSMLGEEISKIFWPEALQDKLDIIKQEIENYK